MTERTVQERLEAIRDCAARVRRGNDPDGIALTTLEAHATTAAIDLAERDDALAEVSRLREELRLADDADEDPAIAGLTAWRDAVRDMLVVARAHAREVGYALAVHGSLHRDLDVVAAPWSENAVDADALVATVSDALVRAELAYGIVEGRVEEKPHGRRAYAIHLRGDGPSYMDLSVAPRATSPAPADEAEEAGPWLVRAADRMAHEVVRLTDSGKLGTRTPLADALLDYATTRHGQTDPVGKVRATGGPRD